MDFGLNVQLLRMCDLDRNLKKNSVVTAKVIAAKAGGGLAALRIAVLIVESIRLDNALCEVQLIVLSPGVKCFQ